MSAPLPVSVYLPPDELLADQKRLRQPVGRGLFGVLDAYAVVRAVAQQPPESREVGRRRDHEYLADTYTTSKDLDIRDEKAVHAFVQTCNPDLIINAAAHTAVDLCESDKENAYAINANGPKYLAMAAKEIDAELVHVSTDYVFDVFPRI